jgi:hypothetical protein
MPTLHILQSIWGMDRVRPDGAEWSMSERFDLIREAGFDGVSAHFHTEADVEAWVGEAKDHGFVIEGAAFPRTIEELRPALELAARHEIHHLTVQGDVRPYHAEEALPILEGWQRLGREHGVPVFIETHRNTISNDLWATRELLDRMPGLPLLADLSHYVCGQEIHVPVTERNATLMERILDSSHAFHGRVSSSEQIQIEIGFPHHQPWVDQFMAWWEHGFRSWLGRAEKHTDSLTFTCELGPPPYAITGPDGRDRSDRWQDAQRLRDMVRACWTRLNDTRR